MSPTVLKLLPRQRLLFVLIAIFFAIGHGHQLLGQFEKHDHGSPYDQQHSSGDADSDHQETSNTHSLVDHATAAVIPLTIVVVEVSSTVFALYGESTVTLPDAPVLGIDHPPQLVG